MDREAEFSRVHNFKLYIATRHRHTTNWCKFCQHLKAFIIFIILYQFQKDLFCFVILYDILFRFIHVGVYSPRARGDNPWGQCFYGNRKVLSLWSLVAFSKKKKKKKKNLCPFDFIHIVFMILYMFIATTGWQPFGANIWMSTERPHHFGHLLQVLKTFLQPLIVYTSFHDSINVYSCGSGADNPKGPPFEVNKNLLSVHEFQKHTFEI